RSALLMFRWPILSASPLSTLRIGGCVVLISRTTSRCNVGVARQKRVHSHFSGTVVETERACVLINTGLIHSMEKPRFPEGGILVDYSINNKNEVQVRHINNI